MDVTTGSLFDNFGGYYSVLIDGVEIARWAPSNDWSEYWNSVKDRSDYSCRWVPNEPVVEVKSSVFDHEAVYLLPDDGTDWADVSNRPTGEEF